MKVIVRAEDIKKHQVLRTNFITRSQEMILCGKYLTLMFSSDMMKEFILPLIEKKVPYMLINEKISKQHSFH